MKSTYFRTAVILIGGIYFQYEAVKMRPFNLKASICLERIVLFIDSR